MSPVSLLDQGIHPYDLIESVLPPKGPVFKYSNVGGLKL